MTILLDEEGQVTFFDRRSARYAFPSEGTILHTMLMLLRSARGGCRLSFNVSSLLNARWPRTNSFTSLADLNKFQNSGAASNMGWANYI